MGVREKSIQHLQAAELWWILEVKPQNPTHPQELKIQWILLFCS